MFPECTVQGFEFVAQWRTYFYTCKCVFSESKKTIREEQFQKFKKFSADDSHCWTQHEFQREGIGASGSGVGKFEKKGLERMWKCERIG